MSAKELKFNNKNDTMAVNGIADKLEIKVYNEWSDRCNEFELNRNQAHLLYLYLKERFESK